MKHYNLAIPPELFDEVQSIADKRGATVAEMFRRFTRLGLLVARLDEEPDAMLLMRDGDSETQIVLG